MEVRYVMTLDDFVAFNLHAARKSGRAGYFILWFGPAAVAALGAIWALQSGVWMLACLLIGMGGAWLFTFPSRYREGVALNIRAAAKRMGERGAVGERMMVLSEETLVLVTETFRLETQWGNVAGVDVVDDYTYVFVSGLLGLIVPRYGFESDAVYETVRNFILRKTGAHD